ncbi:aldehyde dehydrogenase family protein, partial [Pseudoalteromonas sp. SIMBA_148]
MSRPQTLAEWQALAARLTPQLQGNAFINDEFVPAVSGETFESLNPATGERLAMVASCDSADAEIAIRHARAAFK